MDIDPKSLWFDPEFENKHGGFFAPGAASKRIKLPMHDHVRTDMLHLLCRSVLDRKISGSIAELGVWKGHTAKLFHHYFPDKKLFLIDTFNGFDANDVALEAQTTGLQTTKEHFSDTSIQEVKSYIAPLNENLTFIAGYFPESATPELQGASYSIVHLDADLYAPTSSGLTFFYPRLNPGGIMIIHDYNAWPGVRKAVEEFCNQNHIIPIPMPDKSGSCIILKP